MSDQTNFKGRVQRSGEETVGRLAQDLLDSPVLSGALTAVFQARERATRAQEIAMGALNLPSAADLERLTRRVRSVSQRLEGIEDGLDRLDDHVQRSGATEALEQRLGRIEAVLERLEAEQASPAPTRRAPRAGKPAKPRSTATRAKANPASTKASAKRAAGAPAAPRPASRPDA